MAAKVWPYPYRMVWLRTVMTLAGTFAVLWLGGVSTHAVADSPPPPCHEVASHSTPVQSHHAPDKAMKSMACCIACVAGLDVPVMRTVAQRIAVPVSDRAEVVPTGRTPAPEHGPPKA